ncbi:unnamed protein product [Adineta steineri]|uniref:Acetyl-coenzyme A transporter 1 n=1 Tax=Adineta steineri TaxID=433720 RepID=A0A814DEA6_9BILA|nr:unnamed protein product [Adineta steineri]CAF1510737.1 unnamed protein product [Adineta steineri]
MSVKRSVLIWRILLILILYALQGLIQGFIVSIPLYLASYSASWKEQGTFSWVSYPFSFKILWAPLIDSIYSRRIGGRHRTWLIPVQILIGIILIVLSFYLESLLVNLQVVTLAIVFFSLCFLIATQDVVVDGWSVLLFTNSNPQWSSTCQSIGEMIGRFISTTVLMTLESAHFTNKYIRQPLSLPHRPYGLFSLQQFTLFWGVAFIIVSIIMIIFTICKNQSNKVNNENIQDVQEIKPKLFQTYLAILKLFKKPCLRQFALILLTFNVGFAATYYMTNLTLVEHGITRDIVALINGPLLVIHIVVPLCMSRIRHPLLWFARGYIPRLFGSIILAIFICFTPQILHTSYYYPILILLLCLNEGLVYIITVSRVGIYARISDPHIASTYMTLLATISNLGQSISSTVVLYLANWLPKPHAYSIEVGICFILGCIWIGFMWRLMTRLDQLPREEWHLTSSPSIPISTSTTHSQANIIEGSVNVIGANP